jgi:hypothetical protein
MITPEHHLQVLVERCNRKEPFFSNTCDFGSSNVTAKPDYQSKQNHNDCFAICKLHYDLSKRSVVKMIAIGKQRRSLSPNKAGLLGPG